MKSQEQFNPSASRYKKVEDLPEGQKQKFKDVEGGFVRKTAEEDFEKALEESENIVLGRAEAVTYYEGEYAGYRKMETHPMLTVRLDVGGKVKEIQIERDIRLALGIKNLTKKRRDAIENTMPGWMQVEEIENKKDPDQDYKIGEGDILRWAERVKEEIEIIPSSPKKSKGEPWERTKDRLIQKQQDKFLDYCDKIKDIRQEIEGLIKKIESKFSLSSNDILAIKQIKKAVGDLKNGENRRPDPIHDEVNRMDNYYRMSTYSLVDFAEERLDEYQNIMNKLNYLKLKNKVV